MLATHQIKTALFVSATNSQIHMPANPKNKDSESKDTDGTDDYPVNENDLSDSDIDLDQD